jgi:response regulator RpfG family c-di-GMP phosphodiesterase
MNPVQLVANQNIPSLVTSDKSIQPIQNINTTQAVNSTQVMSVTKDPFVVGVMNKLIETSKSVQKVFYETAQLSGKIFETPEQNDRKSDFPNEILVPVRYPTIPSNQSEVVLASKKVSDEDFFSINGHMTKVADLSLAIAQNMNLPKNMIDDIYIAAKLHDVGVPNMTANLSALEFAFLLKNESQLGYEKLLASHFSQSIANMVRQHHERFDGSGYLGLSGNGILMGAQIIGIADTIESLTNTTGDHMETDSHEPISINAALNYVGIRSGLQFNPKVVQSCMNIFSDGYQFPITQQIPKQENVLA